VLQNAVGAPLLADIISIKLRIDTEEPFYYIRDKRGVHLKFIILSGLFHMGTSSRRRSMRGL
jgi:hypothetical protein